MVLAERYDFRGRDIMQKSFGLLLVLSVSQWTDASAQQTILSKFFHNACPLEKNASASDNPKYVELGEVTFVFSDGLMMNQLSNSQKNSGSGRFFVPGGTIQSSLRGTKEIACPQEGVYKITIREVTAPTNGIMFEVVYDPNRVIFAHDIRYRVTREHKLVFSFYDKELLDKIQAKKEVPMIVYAALNPTVIIDCGHGGHDPGVIGYENNAEKNICQNVSKKIADELKKKGIRVILTREHDEYVSPDQRVLHTKKANPCLFVSIHANASSNENVSGVETYYFDRRRCSLRKDCSSVTTCIDEHQKILTLKNKQLAQTVQQMVCGNSADKYQIIDRNIKPEPLQVLMGAHVPAVLIEIGFLTNKQEADLLSQDSYQAHMACGISKGIMLFLAQYNA